MVDEEQEEEVRNKFLGSLEFLVIKKRKLETLYPTKISPILINTLQKKSKLPKKKDSEKLSGNLISPIFPKQISNLVSFSQSNVILNFIWSINDNSQSPKFWQNYLIFKIFSLEINDRNWTIDIIYALSKTLLFFLGAMLICWLNEYLNVADTQAPVKLRLANFCANTLQYLKQIIKKVW